jgi:hypothetical protein
VRARLPPDIPQHPRPQQFYGANNSIQHANVASIIGASINALLEDPDRKFIYVEQAFFTRWWSEQTPAKRAAVQGLVASGQLEFINGGWSMHDEACPSYIDMLDNTALGQRLVFDTFGVVPKTTCSFRARRAQTASPPCRGAAPILTIQTPPSTAPHPRRANRPLWPQRLPGRGGRTPEDVQRLPGDRYLLGGQRSQDHRYPLTLPTLHAYDAISSTFAVQP